MSFEEFSVTYTRTFSQTPIRLIRLSSPLTSYIGAGDKAYRAQVLLCQSHFTSKSITIAFYLNGTAYFEYLTEDKIRQRLQVLNPCQQSSFHKEHINSILERLKRILMSDGIRQDKIELNAKLLSARLLSIELSQDKFKFKFRCDERPELFEQHYVRQLLIQVKELAQRQNYLCELLEHKDQLPQFDAKLFLSTPMTLVEDDEDDEDDEELISSSSTARLWKSAFGRRDGEQFLDVCLLKRAYIKAMEEMSDEEDDDETVSSVLDTLIERVNEKIAEDELDELGLAQRLRKRAAASAAKSSNGHQQIKRLRASSSLRHRGSV